MVRQGKAQHASCARLALSAAWYSKVPLRSYKAKCSLALTQGPAWHGLAWRRSAGFGVESEERLSGFSGAVRWGKVYQGQAWLVLAR